MKVPGPQTSKINTMRAWWWRISKQTVVMKWWFLRWMWTKYHTAVEACYLMQKYLGLGDLEAFMDEQQNRHCFLSLFFHWLLSKETTAIERYQGGPIPSEFKFWFWQANWKIHFCIMGKVSVKIQWFISFSHKLLLVKLRYVSIL